MGLDFLLLAFNIVESPKKTRSAKFRLFRIVSLHDDICFASKIVCTKANKTRASYEQMNERRALHKTHLKKPIEFNEHTHITSTTNNCWLAVAGLQSFSLHSNIYYIYKQMFLYIVQNPKPKYASRKPRIPSPSPSIPYSPSNRHHNYLGIQKLYSPHCTNVHHMWFPSDGCAVSHFSSQCFWYGVVWLIYVT